MLDGVIFLSWINLRSVWRSTALSMALILVPISAQQIAFQGLSWGFIYDETTRSIRPILGIAGASHLGGPVYSGLDYASVAQNGQVALGVTDGQVVLIRGLASGQPIADLVNGAIADPEQILWSTDSTAAILCSTGRLQHITRLDSTPVAETPIDLPSTPLTGRLTTVVADPSARNVVAGIRGRSGGAVFFVSEYGAVSLLASLEDPAAAAFSPDGQDVYLADRAAERILLFRNVGPGREGTVILDSTNGVTDPVGLAISIGQLFVISGTQRTIQSYALPGITFAGKYQLDSEPRGMEPLFGSSYYRLIAAPNPGNELWLLDASSPPSIFFVPRGQ
jgi:hypothetical protein